MTAHIPRIVLASGSPRRKELLAAAGVQFEVVVSDCDETPVAGESPREMVERLALAKARAVQSLRPECTIIGADTTVFIGNTILGKPDDVAGAQEMLRTIQGATHVVWGGIAILRGDTGVQNVSSYSTLVTMCPMSNRDIEWYVSTGEPMDKAGSYAIQGLGLQFVSSIQGSYSNVVGLDIAAVMYQLRLMGSLEAR